MRVHTGIKIHGTKSWRLACSRLLSKYGMNLQNPCSDMLRCCIPDPGMEFGQADQAGAESLIVAHEAEEGRYRRLFQAGIKPHVYIALHLFIEKFRGDFPRDRYWFQDPFELRALPEWKDLVKRIKSDQVAYDLGKRTNHARSYKMKWPTFMLNVLKETEGAIVLASGDAKMFLEMWDKLFPEVVEWQFRVENKIRTCGYLQNLFGYRRDFFGKVTDELIREAISFIPQSSVGCITHNAVVDLQHQIEVEHLLIDIINQKHDSILIQSAPAVLENGLARLKTALEQDLTSTTGVRFKMRAEVSRGMNWAKYSDDNPHGMREV